MYTSGRLGHMNVNHDVKSFHRNSVDDASNRWGLTHIVPQSASSRSIPVPNGQIMGATTELLVQVLLGFSCPDTLLVVVLW